MKSFFEFYNMMEADAALPPPPTTPQPNTAQPASAPPATNTQQAPAPVAPTANKIPPSSGVSPPINDPTKEAKNDLVAELRPAFEKFFKEKFQPFLNKHTMNKDQAMELIGVVVKEIAQQSELSASQAKSAANTGTMTTNSEPKQTPTQPQAAG
jgi:hypothetical protein